MMRQSKNPKMIVLPEPDLTGKKSLEETLAARRSERNFSDESVNLEQVSQLLWAAQGITGKDRFRTAPSAGALYPLEMYVIAGTNDDLPAGVYQYLPDTHSLIQLLSTDLRKGFCDAGLSQSSIKKAPVSFLITGIIKKTTVKYGHRGIQYVFMEAGHAGQNILLQAEALGLSAVPIGAFDDKEIMQLIKLNEGEQPLYLIPVGYATDH